MVDQLPGVAFEPEDVGRALVEDDHRTLRRTQLAGLGADRIGDVLPSDDGHLPLFDTATRIEPSHVLKTRVNFVPTFRVTTSRAQARDVRSMGPYDAHRREVTMQGAVERRVEKYRRRADVILIRRRGSLRLSMCSPSEWRCEAEQRDYSHS